MDRFDRIFELHKLLSAARRPVPRKTIEERLECSRATAKRIIEAMRDFLNAPIEYDHRANGYYYANQGEGMFELPGLWFNASELQALLTLQQLLAEMEPGLLEQQLGPLRQRIDSLLTSQHATGAGIDGRVKLLRSAARQTGPSFQPLASALASRRRIRVVHYNRAQDAHLDRELSPQRLVHYRDNWYLDAWCHLREGLRTFSLDAIESARPLETPALELPADELDRELGASYGIFSGAATATAELRFSPRIARWISRERWHPRQQERWLSDGSYQLSIPYHQEQELVMDILRYGPEVEVISPPALREHVIGQLSKTLASYLK